jgi:hypothetical protein
VHGKGLEKPPKFNLDGENISKLGVKSECPEDTVVIREIKREDVERAGSVRQFLNRRGRRNHIKPNSDADYDGPHEVYLHILIYVLWSLSSIHILIYVLCIVVVNSLT